MSEMGQHGWLVEGETCPECEEYPVVYNGNYFCDGMGNWCDWALPEGAENTEYGQRLITTFIRQRANS